MLFRLLNLYLSALSLTFIEFFVNANYVTFINLINCRVNRNECTVAKNSIKFFLLANNFGTSKRTNFGWIESINYNKMSHHKTHGVFKKELKQIYWGYPNLEQRY